MATLPDLDTTTTGWIGYWNAIDDGNASSIDPTEVLTAGGVVSYEQYDNGVTGEFSSSSFRNLQFRVKTDGWFVIWQDRTQSFGADQAAPMPGYWNICKRFKDQDQRYALPDTEYSRIMSSLGSNLSNWGSITFNTTDVGYYNYEHSSATTFTEVSTGAGSVSYTSGITRYYHAIAGHADSAGRDLQFNSYAILDGNTGSVGARDALAQNILPNAGTFYDTTLRDNNTRQEHVILWA